MLLLSQAVEERYARDLLAQRSEGLGYLLKDRVADGAEFVDALRRVAAGGTAPTRRSYGSCSSDAGRSTTSAPASARYSS